MRCVAKSALRMMGQLQPRHIALARHGVGPAHSCGTRDGPRWHARHYQGCDHGVQQQRDSAVAQPRRSRQSCAATGQMAARVWQGIACGTERGQRLWHDELTWWPRPRVITANNRDLLATSRDFCMAQTSSNPSNPYSITKITLRCNQHCQNTAIVFN